MNGVNANRHTFRKAERISSSKQIEALFANGKSFVAYPLRVIYLIRKDELPETTPVNILISVPKKRFKRAVKRNRIKRLIREAYRLNKQKFHNALPETDNTYLDIVFIYLKDELPSYTEIEDAILKTAKELTIKINKVQ